MGTQPLRLKPFLIGAISAHYPPCHGRSWSSRQPPSGLPNVPGANPRIRFPAPRPRRVAGLRTPLPSKLFGPHEGPARASRLRPVPTALASGPGRPSGHRLPQLRSRPLQPRCQTTLPYVSKHGSSEEPPASQSQALPTAGSTSPYFGLQRAPWPQPLPNPGKSTHGGARLENISPQQPPYRCPSSLKPFVEQTAPRRPLTCGASKQQQHRSRPPPLSTWGGSFEPCNKTRDTCLHLRKKLPSNVSAGPTSPPLWTGSLMPSVPGWTQPFQPPPRVPVAVLVGAQGEAAHDPLHLQADQQPHAQPG